MHSHSEEETHGHNEMEGTKKLAIVSLVNFSGFFVELAGGILFGSVALISDAIHMLFDSIAYLMAFLASFVAEKYDDSYNWSYGVHRVEPLTAFLNGLFLIPMVGFILWKSYQRFIAPIDIGTGPTMIIAFGGLLINVASVYVLQGDDMSLNERGAFYHLLGDAGGSIAVIVSTSIIYFTGIKIIDPIVASLIAVLILWSAIKVLTGSGKIFLHKTPIDIDQVTSDINEIDKVEQVDDIHAWQICSQITVATIHIKASKHSSDNTNAVIHKVHERLSEYGVDHATVEICSGCSNENAHLGDHSH